MPLDRGTVLILGAGGSVPYNYPTGRELRHSLATPSSGLYETLKRLGQADVAIQEVSTRLRRSKSDTIDEFLERYPDHATLVKQAIAFEILQRENIDTQLGCPDDWYSYLLIDVLEDDPNLKDGLLTIVTFNYDLSLDAHVHELLRMRHPRTSEAQIAASVSRLGLIHLYGDVGPVSVIHGEGRQFGRGPAELPALYEIEAAAARIRSITDATSDAVWNSARRAIATAADVIFIGFGWGSENARRLGLKEVAKGAGRIVSTTVGITDLNVVQQHLPEEPQFMPVITGAAVNPTTEMIRRLFGALSQSAG